MLPAKLTGWLRQPSTIMGIATLVGSGAALLGQVLTHQQTVAGGVGLFVFGLTHLLINDNTALPSAMQKLVTDATNAVLQKRLRAAFPELEGDLAGVVAAVEAPAPAGGAVAKVLGVLACFGVLLPVLMLGACSTAQQAADVQKATVGCPEGCGGRPVVLRHGDGRWPAGRGAGQCAGCAGDRDGRNLGVGRGGLCRH